MNIVCRLWTLPVRDDARAHSGFVYQWRGVRERVTRALEGREDVPLVVCGHSLGGAVATVAALELSSAYRCVLITFGSPRVLDWRGKLAFDAADIQTYRVTNGADVVAMVPILWMHHVGTHVEINRKPPWYLLSVLDHSVGAYAAWGRSLVTRRLL